MSALRGTLPARRSWLRLDVSARPLRENLIAMGCAQVATWLLTAATLSLLPRYFGPASFGRLSVAATFGMIVAGVTGLGVSAFVAREVARNGTSAAPAVIAALTAALLASLAAIAAVVLLLPFLGYAHETNVLIVVALVAVPFSTMGVVASSTLQGLEVMRYQAALDVLSKFSGLGVLFGVVLMGAGLIAYSVVTALSGMCITGFLAFLAWKALRPSRARPERRMMLRVVGSSLPMYSNDLLLIFYMSTEIMLLALLANEHEVGVYAASIRLFAAALVVPNVLSTVLFPRLSAAHLRAEGEFTGITYQMMCLLFLAMVPGAIGLSMLSGGVTSVLFGRSFVESGIVTAVLALTLVPTSINVFIARAYVAADRQVRWSLIMAGSFGAKVLFGAAAIVLFEHTAGRPALGGAVSLVAVEYAMAAVAVLLAPAPLRRRLLSGPTLAAAAVGLVALGCTVALRWMDPFFAGVPALAIFAVGMVALGVLPSSPSQIRLAVRRLAGRPDLGVGASERI